MFIKVFIKAPKIESVSIILFSTCIFEIFSSDTKVIIVIIIIITARKNKYYRRYEKSMKSKFKIGSSKN